MVDYVERMQDVQLAAFAIIFGLMAYGRRDDRMLRFIFYSLIVDGVAGIVDLMGAYLPAWIVHGVNYAASPLSYGMLNLAIAIFISYGRWTRWITLALVLVPIPYYIVHASSPDHAAAINVVDMVLFLQTGITSMLVFQSRERCTAAARAVLGIFLAIYSSTELYRVLVFVILHRSADTVYPSMQFFTATVYILSGSVLPLDVIWMINSRIYADLASQIRIDPLTATLNRRGLDEVAQREVAWFHRTGSDLAVAVIDIDHFKKVNDTHGHHNGDRVLTALAECFKNSIRETDFLARTGGEEFVILLPAISPEQARLVLERTRRDVQAHAIALSDGTTVSVTVSIGTSNSHGRADATWDQLHREADRALYAAKDAGRNRTEAFGSLADNTTA